MSNLIFAGGTVAEATTRPDPPNLTDQGLVVRPIGPFGPIFFAQPTIGTVTTVAVGAIVVTLLAVNLARLGAMIFNDAGTRLFVKLGAGATTANFTVRLDGFGYFELPFPAYTGIITAIRAAGPVASVQVTELT